MNELTKKLLAEGYTKDNHPKNVKWYANMHEFEYTSEFLSQSVWEAPCGIMRKGYFTGGYLCYAGIEWRVENNNYNFHCPYRKKECEYFHPLLKNLPHDGKCAWHLSDKPYDYMNSAEKIEDERDVLITKNLNKRFGTNGMISCACCHINHDTCEPYFRYDPENCIRFTDKGCFNEWCWCTQKERDLTLANIYYDVKTTEEYKYGFIVEPIIQLTKGIKLFDSKKPLTDLEMYLKTYPDAPLRKERGKRKHSRPLFFAEHHGYKYDLEILNVRIEKRESRDLLQDLQDIKDGIQVIHESDRIKKAKADKKERRQKYQERKALKKEKKINSEQKQESKCQISLFEEAAN